MPSPTMFFLVLFITIPIIVATTKPISIKIILSEESNSPIIGKYLIFNTSTLNSSLSNCSYNHYKGFFCRLQVLFTAEAGVSLFFLCVLLFFFTLEVVRIIIECVFQLNTCKHKGICICITICV